MPTITTDLFPDAVPKAVSMTAPAGSWGLICEAPSYDVPVTGFVTGAPREVRPGVIEITSPALVTNVSAATAWVSLRITRASTTVRTVVHRIPVPAADVLPLPVNGQFLLAGDRLEIEAQTADALHLTLSYTQGLAEEES